MRKETEFSGFMKDCDCWDLSLPRQEERTLIYYCKDTKLREYFFGHIVFSADAFSSQQKSRRISLVQSPENGRFRRPPKPSVLEAGRFRRHRKESRSRYKMNGLVRVCSDQPNVFGSCVFLVQETFSCYVHRLQILKDLRKSGGY